jgi:hypothetical protein
LRANYRLHFASIGDGLEVRGITGRVIPKDVSVKGELRVGAPKKPTDAVCALPVPEKDHLKLRTSAPTSRGN